jgi:beta-catenin-like protein 1
MPPGEYSHRNARYLSFGHTNDYSSVYRVKALLINLEKKINKNQKLRIKHAGEHEKFMESEFELHSEIGELHVVAAFPELYPVLIQNNAVMTLFGLITHENTDISIAAISLLQEMTEVDTLLEQPDIAKSFLAAIQKVQGLELLVQNLFRLDEESDEDAQGVHNTMAIFENLLEIDPSLSVYFCEKTYVLRFLSNRLRTKKFDANKLYCSEILSILMQSDVRNTRTLTHLPTDDEHHNSNHNQNGLELLLESVAVYRKKEVDIADEQVCYVLDV